MQKKGRCKHLNDTHANTHCLAGVEYGSVVPDPDDNSGIAFRYPCTDMALIYGRRRGGEMSEAQAANYARRGTCAGYEEFTDKEIKAYEARIEERHKRFALALPLIARIKKERRGADWQGVEACPACGGRLRLSHTPLHGHVSGQCETEGCLSWTE